VLNPVNPVDVNKDAFNKPLKNMYILYFVLLMKPCFCFFILNKKLIYPKYLHDFYLYFLYFIGLFIAFLKKRQNG